MIASTDNRSAEALSLLDEFNRLSPLEQSLTSENNRSGTHPAAFPERLPGGIRCLPSKRRSHCEKPAYITK